MCDCVTLLATGGLDLTLLSEFRERFVSDAKSQLAQNVCVKHDLLDVLRSSQHELTQHVYNCKVILMYCDDSVCLSVCLSDSAVDWSIVRLLAEVNCC